jgi:hypothetical protein
MAGWQSYCAACISASHLAAESNKRGLQTQTQLHWLGYVVRPDRHDEALVAHPVQRRQLF